MLRSLRGKKYFCRKNAPNPFIFGSIIDVDYAKATRKGYNDTEWPVFDADDWCGEFEEER